jgi:hypothetical protein
MMCVNFEGQENGRAKDNIGVYYPEAKSESRRPAVPPIKLGWGGVPIQVVTQRRTR